MGFSGIFARLESRLSQMAGNQAPGRSASMLTRTVSRGRYSANSDPPCNQWLAKDWVNAGEWSASVGPATDDSVHGRHH